MASRAYSYIRFSTPKQQWGDSLRRQLKKTQDYAAKRGFELDESLRLYDLGLSAYHGVHVEKGALGVFLELVKAGRVPIGSFLIVENLDRLSRQKPRLAMRNFLDLIDAGIIIITLTNEKEHSAKSADDDPDSLASSLGEMIRARKESERKAELLGAAWEEKRLQASNGGKKLTAKCPAWLELTEDRKEYKKIEERAEIVERIFRFKLAGKSSKRIAREFNMDKNIAWRPKSPRRGGIEGWWASYIEKILRTRAVMGEFQPHKLVDGRRVPEGAPIANYYPAVITEELFYEVQQIFKDSQLKTKKGKVVGRAGNSRFSNLFVHLIKCGYCGASMQFQDKMPGTFLTCSSAIRRVACQSLPVHYSKVESAVLRYCKGLNPADLLPGHEEAENRIRSLQGHLSVVKGKLEMAAKEVEILTNRIASTESDIVWKQLENKLESTLKEKSALEKEQVGLQSEIDILATANEDVEERLENLSQLFDAMERLTGQELVDLKLRLRQDIRRLIKRIDVYPEGKPRYTQEWMDRQLRTRYALCSQQEFLEHRNRLQKMVENPREYFELRVWFVGGSRQRLQPGQSITRIEEFDEEAGVYRQWHGTDGEEICYQYAGQEQSEE
jgi:DNA invertase Pin-like site-specific DNA recombinase